MNSFRMNILALICWPLWSWARFTVVAANYVRPEQYNNRTRAHEYLKEGQVDMAYSIDCSLSSSSGLRKIPAGCYIAKTIVLTEMNSVQSSHTSFLGANLSNKHALQPADYLVAEVCLQASYLNVSWIAVFLSLSRLMYSTKGIYCDLHFNAFFYTKTQN